jgi:hypothetical protein
VVNAPWIFNACWAIIRVWLDPVTQEKVKFVYDSEIRELIDKNNIPDGFARDSDPLPEGSNTAGETEKASSSWW